MTTTVTVERISSHDEPRLREWFDLECAARAMDEPGDPPPCWTDHRAGLSAPWPGEDTAAWLARGPDGAVGAVVLHLPLRDNTDNAAGAVVVHPAQRRRGIGTRLLALLRAEATAAGRVRLSGDIRSPLDGPMSPGAAFAAAAGAHDAQSNVRRRLRLPAGAEETRRALEAAATTASRGYELVSWTGDTPDAWVEDVARLTARMSTDAPQGDRHWEPEVHDTQRVRERDAMVRARGRRLFVTAARDQAGRLVAFTELSLEASDDRHADTWNTLVAPEHRGRRLGMRVKLANLALARQRFPDLQSVDTYNAASNAHMIAINDAMGFRPHDLLGEYELDL